MALTEDDTGAYLERIATCATRRRRKGAEQARMAYTDQHEFSRSATSYTALILIQPGGFKIVQQGEQHMTINYIEKTRPITSPNRKKSTLHPDTSDLHKPTCSMSPISRAAALGPISSTETPDPDQGERLQLADVYIDLHTTEIMRGAHAEREGRAAPDDDKQREPSVSRPGGGEPGRNACRCRRTLDLAS